MKYYAVKVGVIPGIYNTWSICKENVNGYKGAVYKSFFTFEEAKAYIDEGNIVNTVLPVSKVPVNTVLPISKVPVSKIPVNTVLPVSKVPVNTVLPISKVPVNTVLPISKVPVNTVLPISTSIYVDGGHNKRTGNEAWASIVDYKGIDMICTYKQLLSDMILRDVMLPVGNRTIIVAIFKGLKVSHEAETRILVQQNNGAELLALVGGLRIALNSDSNIRVIYSDSSCVISWSLRLGDTQRNTFDPIKVKYIDELILLRRAFENIGGSIVKISGDLNKADLGYHR